MACSGITPHVLSTSCECVFVPINYSEGIFHTIFKSNSFACNNLACGMKLSILAFEECLRHMMCKKWGLTFAQVSKPYKYGTYSYSIDSFRKYTGWNTWRKKSTQSVGDVCLCTVYTVIRKHAFILLQTCFLVYFPKWFWKKYILYKSMTEVIQLRPMGIGNLCASSV